MSRRGGMRTPADTERLESAIGYTFNDKNLLLCALTHSSYSNEKKSTMPWRNT
jgi:dsRNA-specific ribonuclease